MAWLVHPLRVILDPRFVFFPLVASATEPRSVTRGGHGAVLPNPGFRPIRRHALKVHQVVTRFLGRDTVCAPRRFMTDLSNGWESTEVSGIEDGVPVVRKSAA